MRCVEGTSARTRLPGRRRVARCRLQKALLQQMAFHKIGVREIKAQTGIFLSSQLERRLRRRIHEKDPLLAWMPLCFQIQVNE